MALPCCVGERSIRPRGTATDLRPIKFDAPAAGLQAMLTRSRARFSQVPVGLHVLPGLRQLSEGEHAIDDRLDPPGREGRQQLTGEPGDGFGALLDAAHLVGDAEQREAFRMQRPRSISALSMPST